MLELIALKALLKQIEYDVVYRSCPVCGGKQYHDSVCVLAAFLYPEKAESYKRNTGDTHISEMLFKVENDEDYEFLRDELYQVPGFLNPVTRLTDDDIEAAKLI